MNPQQLQPGNNIPFEEWKAELIRITAEKTGREIFKIKINDEAARDWYENGFTPFATFRETYSNENDCE